MAVSSLISLSRVPGLLLAGMLAALPVHAALAWQQTAPSSQPAPVYVPPPNAQFKQSMRQQQVRDQLQKNQLEEQLRQSSAATAERPSAGNPAQAEQLEQANRAQNDSYRARQQSLIDRDQNTLAPPVIRRIGKPVPKPASARSGG